MFSPMSNLPLVPHVDLEALAGAERYGNVIHIEGLDSTVKVELRGKALRFLASSRRLLWQALGHEYIEPELLDFIDAIPPGSTLFDIGASTGIFAIYAACSGVQVAAFEPEAANFAVLSQNVFLNRARMLYPAQCFNLALSDKTGLGNMYIKKYEAGGHLKILGQPREVGASATFEPEHIQPVLTFTLDDFLEHTQLPAPEYIKIDVDGAELLVLRGLSGVLRSPQLRSVFIELEDNKPDAALCISALNGAGLKLLHKKQVQNYSGLHNLIFSKD
jgi:FkbM family methyltransferase